MKKTLAPACALLLVLASRGMTELPVESEQFVLAYGQTTALPELTVVSIRSGNDVLMEITATKRFATVIFSSAQLQSGATYSVCADDAKLADIRLTSRVTSSGVQSSFGGRPDNFRPGGPGSAPGGAPGFRP